MKICDTLAHSECFVSILFDDKTTSSNIKSVINSELNINPQNYSLIGKGDIISKQIFMRILKEDNDIVPAKLIQLGIDFVSFIMPFKAELTSEVFHFSLIEMAATCAPKLLHFLATSDIKFKRPLISSVLAAIYAGHLDNIRYLIDTRGFDVNSVYPLGTKQTILHSAVKLNQVEVARFLLQRGARTNLKNEEKMRPLHLAIMRDRPDVVEILLQYDAKIDDRDVNGELAFRTAVQNGKFGSLRVLLNYLPHLTRSDSRIFCFAIESGHLEMVKMLLNHGFTLNLTSKEGQSRHTYLHQVVLRNHLDMARYFLETVSSPYEPMIEELLKRLNEKFPLLMGRLDLSDPPAVTAILLNRMEMLEILLKHGFNPNHFIFKGTTTVLHLACELKKYKMAEVLICHGADTNALNSSGVTAFSLIEDPEILSHLKNLNIYL